MPRLGWLAVGVLTVFTAGSAGRGCRDLVQSATHLRYAVVRDMRMTAVIEPQKKRLLPPDSASVPVTGRERDTGRDAMARTMVNPTRPEDLDASTQRGANRFRIMCVPCHGGAMNGLGPVAAKFMQAADLLSAPVRARSDGYIYATIRHGGLVMPALGAQVTRDEAWDLVNYVRFMQRKSPR